MSNLISKFKAKTEKDQGANMLIVAIVFGFLGALLGLMLRYFLWQPFPIHFQNALHGHSHVMLLAWLLPALLILVYRLGRVRINSKALLFYYLLYFSCLGLLLVFPLRGYDLYTIAISSLHLLLSIYLFRHLLKRASFKPWQDLLCRWAYRFYLISSVGPLLLGPLKVLGLKGTDYYQQAIYFYVHFLSFGSLTLLALILFYKALGLNLKGSTAIRSAQLFIRAVPLLWSQKLSLAWDYWFLDLSTILGVLLTFSAFWLLRKPILASNLLIKTIVLFWLVLATAQLLSAYPEIGAWAMTNRQLFIAYLHLLFLGILSPIIWVGIMGDSSLGRVLIGIYLFCFCLSEIALIAPFSASWRDAQPLIIFSAYLILLFSWLALFIAAIRILKKRPDSPLPK